MGRVDLHNHLLYHLDDGATGPDETLAIARELVKAGYTDVATTPHSKPDMDPPAALVATRLAEVQALLARENIPLRLHPGCENHLTPEFLARCEAGNPRPLGTSRYVLVELPFATPVTNLRELLYKILLKGLRPVLAHPERCANFTAKHGVEHAREMFDAGAQFQIEVGSIAGIYGGPAKKVAQALLDEGLVSLAATDVHHPKGGAEILGTGLKALGKLIGPTRLAQLTEDNPARVLRGEPIFT